MAFYLAMHAPESLTAIRKLVNPRALLGGGRRPVAGAPPGVIQVDPEAKQPRVRVIAYGPDSIDERDIASPSELEPLRGRYPVTWVNVDGLGDAETIRAIGELYGLHRLALEDVVNSPQRAKAEDYGKNLFVVSHMAHDSGELEQVSLFLGEGFAVTFQEHEGDCLDRIRERLREGRGKIRSAGADYLAYAILDAVVDSSFPLLERLGDRIAELEEDVMERTDRSMARSIQDVKREVHRLARVALPAREAMKELQRDESDLISEGTKVYLRDCYDHAVQITDLLHDARELASGLMDLHQSTLSNKLNDVMKFLTIFSTIFIPLSFIAGLYGMNFDPEVSRFNMPELGWAFGYPMALGLMAGVAITMLAFFWRRGWLGSTD